MFERVNEALGARLRSVVVPFVVQRLLLTTTALFASRLIPQARGFRAEPYLAPVDLYVRWDSIYYLSIAHEGYQRTPQLDSTSFFPGYPAFVALFDVFMPLPWAAVLVAQLAAMGALWLLHVWVEDVTEDAETADRAVIFALVFPSSYFLSAAYPVGVFLLFAIGATMAYRREKLGLASVLVFLACLCRPQGFLCLTVPFGLVWLYRDRTLRGFPWFALSSFLALGCLCLIHWGYMGDPFAFMSSRGVSSLPAFWEGARERPARWAILLDEGISRNLALRLLNWSALGVAFAAVLDGLRRRELDHAAFVFLALALPLAFYGQLFDLASMARYALCAFPIFLLLARLLRGRAFLLAVMGMQMVQVILFTLFASWYWVE